MARRWSDLSDRSRRLIIAAAIAEPSSRRRYSSHQAPSGEPDPRLEADVDRSGGTRHSAGAGPLSSFAFGRRQRAEGVELATPGEA